MLRHHRQQAHSLRINLCFLPICRPRTNKRPSSRPPQPTRVRPIHPLALQSQALVSWLILFPDVSEF